MQEGRFFFGFEGPRSSTKPAEKESAPSQESDRVAGNGPILLYCRNLIEVMRRHMLGRSPHDLISDNHRVVLSDVFEKPCRKVPAKIYDMRKGHLKAKRSTARDWKAFEDMRTRTKQTFCTACQLNEEEAVNNAARDGD